ncbi:MAG: 23S rRNA (pseudouridine(1915)-N(3))-methyltransferase RlmH [Woeseiaceae bacterium]|nr:23S rRNA (pseudouridine(1915)-N(3))-methyltransferase RlmH [Woeseiaceae bacterium]
MHIRLIAVGERQPAWVDEAVAAYTSRLPPAWRFRIDPVAAARRVKNAPPKGALRDESAAILSRLGTGERMILLDERGRELTSREFSGRLADWQGEGRDVAFVIGGPDGVAADCRERAEFTWSLSKLTLPHGLARVVFAEQLYRAATLLSGHPYHRD